ncbi:MAG: 3-deoxy-7-phosphoheptulonate synthase [Gammaproteobacteria bacterium]|nr:3-deoxy-7-phosphoheptulonate synthase [Gammaproteobacteria bacterium]
MPSSMLSSKNLKAAIPVPTTAAQVVSAGRTAVQNILSRRDHRLLVIVGPCSIHDPKAALEYAQRLNLLAEALKPHLAIMMRTYFEKPRTTIGWRGLMSDPHLDGTCDMPAGVERARRLLIDINALGVPCATESLDPLLVDYTDDLVGWTALGARTAESQTHRAMASGLPMPVGMKNGTEGQITVAIDAVETAAHSQTYLGANDDGQIAVRASTGNPFGHVVLRGGAQGPNYGSAHVQACEQALAARGLAQQIVIDCSHANSGKVPGRQVDVLADVSKQLLAGNESIVGVMLESHLFDGNQPIGDNKASLRYGVSITDACLGWKDTEAALRELAEGVGRTLSQRADARTKRTPQQAA